MKTITAQGIEFKVEHTWDTDSGPPWEESDGHGTVRKIYCTYGLRHTRLKKPGERVLYEDSSTYWLYDWASTCRKARAEGWNAKPCGAPDRIERAVQSDFDYLKGYLAGDWQYIGVTVTAPDGQEVSLWGVETSDDDYVEEIEHELADELARAILKERAEVQYWAERDVVTT
jgi:hypothetical protein